MLTIGEFSRLGRVSARMLRHYDALGLLCPEQVGENGYRYYQQEQLGKLLQIRRLQDYGFPLAQVGELLKLPEEALLGRLHRRRLDAHYEIYQMQERLRQLEADILRMEGTPMLTNKYDVIELKEMIKDHVACTGSEKGKKILDNFGEYLPKFKKIIPYDYDRMLKTIVEMEEKGLSAEQAQIEACYANTNK